MIFIFGYDTVRKNIGPLEEKQCPNCSNHRHWMLNKITNVISLFFIPLIPVKTRYLETCPVCQYSQELSKEEYQQARSVAELNKTALHGEMTNEEYQEKLNNLKR